MNWTEDIAAEVHKVARARRKPAPQELRRQFGPLFDALPKTMRFHHDKMIRDLQGVCQHLPARSIGVEIGSFAGESALLFMLSGKVLQLTCVDPWPADFYRNSQVPAAEKVFDRLNGSMGGRIVKQRSTGLAWLTARAQSKTEYDFIYIDGDHSYENVKAEIQAAIPLIKAGGLLCGHDYGFRKSPGVEQAVKEICVDADIRFRGYSWIVYVDRLRESLVDVQTSKLPKGD